MKITIIGRQMNVDEDLKTRVSKKLAKFDKFFDTDSEAFVTFSRKRNMEIIEVTVNNRGTIFRCEEENSTFQNALDKAVDSIERQIGKNKTRLEKNLRTGAYKSLNLSADTELDEVFKIRTKTFPFMPMSVEEAIMQMNLLGHQFYVFANAEDGERTCVVYKRKDGAYGLLMPE